jgi:hypothetical protein
VSEEATTSPATPLPAEPPPSPYVWSVETDKRQDRWTLLVPRTTYDDRQLVVYADKHGQAPPEDWTSPGLPDYAGVTASFAGSTKTKRTVLKAEFVCGSSEPSATIAPAAFGRRTASQITIAAAGKRRFRRARLKTAANRLNIISVAAGTVSAVIIILLTTGVIGRPGQALSDGDLALVALAALLAFCAPVLAWIATALVE